MINVPFILNDQIFERIKLNLVTFKAHSLTKSQSRWTLEKRERKESKTSLYKPNAIWNNKSSFIFAAFLYIFLIKWIKKGRDRLCLWMEIKVNICSTMILANKNKYNNSNSPYAINFSSLSNRSTSPLIITR